MIDKPEGITSAQTVNIVKKVLKLKKAGHSGTLDPFATGILIICLNRATKIVQYLSNLDKAYIGTMILGISTDTQDLKGIIQKIKPIDQQKLHPEEIRKVFSKYQGDIWQIPPMFSALKYKGSRLYNLARKGIKISLNPRKAKIYQLDIIHIEYDSYPSITFQVRCSKGTYIRTLCHDIGESFGCSAYMSHLRRVEIGDYLIGESIPLNQFLKLSYKEQYEQILPFDKALSHLHKIILRENREIVDRVKTGFQISEQDIWKTIPGGKNALDEIFAIYSSEGHLLAIAKSIEKSFSQKNEYKVEKILI